MAKDSYVLRYLPIAVEDLISIFDWISLDSQNRAAAFVEKLDKRIGLLESTPLMGRLPKDEKLKKLGYRILILDDYLVFYIIRGQIIEIHRVIHGSRQLEDII
jgi:plasmid stabilization system protein ParE